MKPVLRPTAIPINRFSATVSLLLWILSVCQGSNFNPKVFSSKPGESWKLDLPILGLSSGSRRNNVVVLFSARKSFALTLSRPSSTSRCIAAVQSVPSNLQIWTSSCFNYSRGSLGFAGSCSLDFGKDGNLVLKEGDESLWESRTAGMDVKVLELLENGNLILRNEMHDVVWESFDGPDLNPRPVIAQSNAEEIESRYARKLLREDLVGVPANDKTWQSSSPRNSRHRRRNLAFKIIFPVAAFVIVCIVVVILKTRICPKSRNLKTEAQIQSLRRISQDEMILKDLDRELPPRFTYAEMYQATNGFKKKLGAGAYGAVFEGALPEDGSKVAVKVFHDIETPGCLKGFCAEVMAIGCMTHRNLVPLRGFCVEDDHRMLVYELMVNGSLDKVLFRRQWGTSTDLKADASGEEGQGTPAAEDKEEELLSWEKRRSIAIGSARALAFLHNGGERTVIHCDVKPENILLDENWEPRVSDFGLSKLIGGCSAGDGPPPLAKAGGIRGTLGYVAPEWRKEGGPENVTGSADVYSLGVVLLELVAGRRCVESGKSYLPGAAFDLLAEGGDLAELLDERLLFQPPPAQKQAAHRCAVRVFAKVALWCIQEDPQLRPSMASVVAMLIGSDSVSPPPVCRYYAGSSHFFDDHPRASTTTNTVADETSATSVYSNSWQISFLTGR